MLLEVGRPPQRPGPGRPGGGAPGRLALTELTGQSEAGLEDLFDDAFYLHLLAATGTEELDPAELAGELDRVGGSSGLPARPRTATARPVTSCTSSSACCPPSAASPCTVSPGCSPPWTSCSLGACRPPTRC